MLLFCGFFITKMEKQILEVNAPVIFDDSISEYEIHSHQPYGSMAYNNNDEIRIVIQNQDSFVLPSRSSLHICGRLKKQDQDAATATTHLVNNAICYLFESIKYELNSVEIDSSKNLGITTLMKGYLSLNENQANQNVGWLKVGTTVGNNNKLTNDQGYFEVIVPLSMLLGFAEDYQRIIVNAKHELILTRANSDANAVIRAAAGDAVAEAYTITLNKVSWRVPHLKLSDKEKIRMLNYIAKDKKLTIPFRSWALHDHPALPQSTRHVWSVKSSTHLERPRYVIIGFQTNRKNRSEADASHFDHCSVRDVKVFLNTHCYPPENMNLNINQNQYALLYQSFFDFQRSYYGKAPEPLLKKEQFLQNAPLLVFDCAHQSEPLKTGTIDLKIEIETIDNIPENTTAFCLVLHDKIVEYNVLTNRVQKIS